LPKGVKVAADALALGRWDGLLAEGLLGALGVSGQQAAEGDAWNRWVSEER
jgi:hypothetical protein